MECEISYEELARFAAGGLGAERAGRIDEHLESCGACRQRLLALKRVDAGLRALPRLEPRAAAVLEARRLLSVEVRGRQAPDVMTLDEVAEFLRLPLEALDELVTELPAFEVAGFVRVRRERLTEWLCERERSYLRARAESEVARMLAGRS